MGATNRLCIPMPLHSGSPAFCERLNDFSNQTQEFAGNAVTFVVEKPRPPNAHAVTIDEIIRVLACVPASDLRDLKFVVLRQPKRKEEILSSVWGRYLRDFEFQNRWGGAVILEAMDLGCVLRWRKPLHPLWREELETLRSEGHAITETAKHFEIRSTLETVRQTQLFRTLPHEIGHHVHASRARNFSRLPWREKEAFAETYARNFIGKWGAILSSDLGHEG